MTAIATEDRRTLFRVAELSERWSISRSKIYQLLDRGEISSVHIGTSRRVPLSAVVAFESKLKPNGSI